MSYPPPGMFGPQLIARAALAALTTDVRIDGLVHVPRAGPVLLVARHYHHLLDGAAIVRHVPRPVHIVVALDWATDARTRRWMERLCGWAQYPVILRPATTGARSAYAPDEVGRYLRRGLRTAAALLRDGRVVLVFPEGRPAVDPAGTLPPRDAAGMLPFARGFATILAAARRAGAGDVAVVPVGLSYARSTRGWDASVRFGAPLADAGVTETERAVRALSAHPKGRA